MFQCDINDAPVIGILGIVSHRAKVAAKDMYSVCLLYTSRPITSEYLDYDEVMEKYDEMMEWLSKLYVDTLNMIHYMHDKYYYEAAEMALIDTDVRRTFATGIAGFSQDVYKRQVENSDLRNA